MPVNRPSSRSAPLSGRPRIGSKVPLRDAPRPVTAGRSAGASFAVTALLIVGASLLVLDFRIFVFFLVGMSPTIVAFIIDVDRRKYAARSVGCLNFAGLTPYFRRLIDNSGSGAVLDLASDMTAWLVVGGAASVGWLIHFFMPVLVGQVMQLIDLARVGALRRRQRELVKEWGEDIRNGTAPGQRTPPGR